MLQLRFIPVNKMIQKIIIHIHAPLCMTYCNDRCADSLPTRVPHRAPHPGLQMDQNFLSIKLLSF